jgi:GntR family transcriptional regulator
MSSARPRRPAHRPLERGGDRRRPAAVARSIAELATARGLGPGDPLPSEPELARLFDVGRTTVREALLTMQHDGWIQRSQGSRTTLTSLFRRPALGLEVLEPLEELARRQGWNCGTEATTFGVGEATEEEALQLSVGIGSPVTRLSRLKTIDEDPLALMRSVVPERTASVDALREAFRDSITRLIAETRALRFAESEISAAAAGDELAAMLGLSPGSPVIVLEERFFADGPDPLVWNTNWIVPGRIRLDLLRRVPRRGAPAT